MTASKSSILVISGEEYFTRFIVKASTRAGHQTFVLIRESTLSDARNANIIAEFKNLGAKFLIGHVHHLPSLVEAVKRVHIVISTVCPTRSTDQFRIIPAIRQAGNVLRFIMLEFGPDVDQWSLVEPAKSIYCVTSVIRQLADDLGIPYTCVFFNLLAGLHLNKFPELYKPPPLNKVDILGAGDLKGVFVAEEDAATYVIKAVDDLRTVNKNLRITPPANIYSSNDLVSLWERKQGISLERIYLSKQQVLTKIKEACSPRNFFLAVMHSVFVKGDRTNFEINPETEVEATHLYPDVRYITVDEYLNKLNSMQNEVLGRKFNLVDSSISDRTTMVSKSKILIIGGGRKIDKCLLFQARKAGHQTFVPIMLPSYSDTTRALIEQWKALGAHIISEKVFSHQTLVEAVKKVDVVIAGHTVFQHELECQKKIIAAIKEAGNVKRFFPSEFGLDVDRGSHVEPAKSIYEIKAQIRRITEAAGIPYTYVSSNLSAGIYLSNLNKMGYVGPPVNRITIFGNGNRKGVFVTEEDIAKYVIKAVDDPRTLNKTLHIRPPANIYSSNDLISLLERKRNISLQKFYLSEEQILRAIYEALPQLDFFLAELHSAIMKGDQTNFEINPETEVEATQLYPDVKYITVDEYLI